MFKTNQKANWILNTFFNLLAIVVIIFNNSNMVFSSVNNWVEVSRTKEGIQYVDRNSLNNKGKSIIEITTKYSKINANTSEKIEDNIYIMRINCISNEFKDISVNGKNNLSARWEASNGDKLLDDVISDSCKNV
tara:strand:+ start:113 stop:514 length:402 start_codon:yes stop_codon:yes gene_type:complete